MTDFDRSRVGFDVDDISDSNTLLLNAFVDAGIESELLRSLDRFESDDDVRDGLAVAGERVLRLCWGQLDDLSLIDLLGFLDTQT